MSPLHDSSRKEPDMLPASVLVFLIPLIAGATTYALRHMHAMRIIVAAAACALVMLLLAQPFDTAVIGVPVDGRLDLLGRALQVHPQDRLALLSLFGCAVLLLVASWRTPENWTFVPIGMAMLSVLSAALMVRPVQYAGLAFVIAGALGALMIQADQTIHRATQGARRYLISSVLALPAFLGAGYLAQRAAATSEADAAAAAYGPAVVLLLLGVILVIGALPLFTWIYSTAQDAPPLTTAFLGTIGVGAASFLLLTFVREFSWFHDSETMRTTLRAGGIVLLLTVTALGWTQQSLSGILGSALLLDLGCVLLETAARTQQGVEAIAFGIMARALSMGLFSIGAALLRERCNGDDFAAIRGVGSREPWLALAIGMGGLSMAGLPGTIGFVAGWVNMRALSAEVEIILIIALAGLSIAIGVLRALSASFDGVTAPTKIEYEQARGERWTVGIFIALVLGLGFLPMLLSPLAQAIAAAYR